jgi:uncharacterized protein DUF1573
LRRRPTRGLRAARAAACALALALALDGCEELGLDAGGPPPLPPRLTFGETSYDFGRAAQGVPVEHRFVFTNDGGTDLTIINLRAACDCEAAVVDTHDIAPHGAGAVRARFDTDAVYGAQRRTITVYSNDPAQRAVVLTLTGEVLLDVAPEPAQVYLGVVPPSAPLLHAVAVHTGSEAVHLGAPESDAPQLIVQLDAATDGTAAATLAIGTAGDARPGPFSAIVRVPTTSPRHPLLRIPVAGIIAADAPVPRSLAPLSPPGAGGTAPPTPCPDTP